MSLKSLITIVEVLFAVSILATPTPRLLELPSTDDDFVVKESPIALHGVLKNIGPVGRGAIGAAPGIVVASPSKSNPDCKR